MPTAFCQAGGISRRMARKMSTPPACRISSMLSSVQESEPSIETSGRSCSSPGRSALRKVRARASAQLRLPRMVLISPLCAR